MIRICIFITHNRYILFYLVLSVFCATILFSATQFVIADEDDNNKPNDKYLEILKSIQDRPGDVQLGNALRVECRKEKYIDLCIDDLNKLTDTYPEIRELRYNAALAYVDKLPGFSLYKQGWLSTRSMAHMTKVIDAHPGDWLAFYIRGMNNLHWPQWFKRTGAAIEDLQKCIDIIEAVEPKARQDYYVLCYIALGDAYAKNIQSESAYAIWKRGLAAFPPSKQIKQRLNLKKDELSAFVDKVRDLDKPIDTDLIVLQDNSRL